MEQSSEVERRALIPPTNDATSPVDFSPSPRPSPSRTECPPPGFYPLKNRRSSFETSHLVWLVKL